MPKTRNENIRWLLLVILLVQRQQGAAEVGGWVKEGLLRRLLAAEGYPLSVDELRMFGDYLADANVACIEKKNSGDFVAPDYKYRLTARGMRVADREVVVPGIGINAEDE